VIILKSCGGVNGGEIEIQPTRMEKVRKKCSQNFLFISSNFCIVITQGEESEAINRNQPSVSQKRLKKGRKFMINGIKRE
jgi:hypothetical protein